MDSDESNEVSTVETSECQQMPDDQPTTVAQKSATPLLRHDVKELENVSKYATKKEGEIQKLEEEFVDMGKLRLIWDSKIPEKNKRFYYFFSLSSSNREEVLEEIRKYLDFYKELSNVVGKINHIEEMSESERENPYTIILDLNEKLSNMSEEAKSGKKSTSSSTIYELHKQFITKHEKLENMIKRVECVALKQGLRKATEGWQQSLQAIGNLTTDLRNTEAKYDQVCDRFDRLLLQNEQLLEQQSKLLENNTKLEQQQEVLLQENVIIKTILKSIAVNDQNKKEQDKKKEGQ